MGTEFYGLESASRALNVFQEAMQVTSQNIANASTTGYSRQTLNLTSVGPDTGGSKYYTNNAAVGEGVQATGVAQIRDSFLDMRYRTENAANSMNSELTSSLSQMEDVVNELNGSDDTATGLSGQMSTLVSDMQKLLASPDDESLASTVQSQMKVVTQVVQSDYAQFSQLSTQIKQNLSTTITGGTASSSSGDGGVNAILQNIQALNKQISTYEISGQTANDLRDQRNNLLDQLSSDFDITVQEQKGGSVTVALAGDSSEMLIDSGNNLNQLKMNADSTGVEWQDGTAANVTGGTAGADLQIINGDGTGSGANGELGIPAMQTMLDDFAKGLTASVNAIAEKNGGKDLLSATGASDFSLTSDWQNDPSLIVENAGSTDTSDYVSQFITMMGEKGTVTSQGSAYGGTLQDFSDSISMSVANRLSYVNQMASYSASSLTNLSQQRQSVSGVSEDEEGVNLIKFQQSYSAAARVITSINDMLNTLINVMGV